MYHFNQNQDPSQAQRIKQFQNFLEQLDQTANKIGTELTANLVQLFLNSNSPLGTETSVPQMLREVEETGIELTPGLVALIQDSPTQTFRDAIAIYQTYDQSQVRNPAGLFYKILENEVEKAVKR